MTSDAKLKELSTKRSSIKGRLTKFKSHLDTLVTLESIPTLELSKLDMKLTRIKALFVEFDNVQGQIEVINDSNQLNELNTRDSFEQEFDNCIVSAQEIIHKHGQPSKLEDKSSICSHHCHDHENSDSAGYSLPDLLVPKFSGNYSKWLGFKEIYCSLIHDNDKIKTIHKYHYLCSYLEGEAADILSNLEITESNYHGAWSLLCSRYDDKRQLINNHLKALFNIESFRETDKNLRCIITHINKNLRALNTLGLPTDKWDVLIVHTLSSKLDNRTAFKWEEHRNTLPEIFTLDDFFSFLKSRANILETFSHSKTDRTDKGKHVSHFTNTKAPSKSFVATFSKEPPTIPKVNLECILCKGSHRLYDCKTFKSKTIEERVSVVSNLNLCYNCLRPGHSVKTCKLPGTCRSCKKRHNTLLHSTPSDGGTPFQSTNTSIVMPTFTSSEVLLCTAIVRLTNPETNESISARALLDSGSQLSFISEEIKLKLKLTSQPSNVSIVAIGNNPLKLNTDRCAVQLHSNTSSFQVSMMCLVLKSITDDVPKIPLDIKCLNLNGFDLADPYFNEPSPVQMLIGCDLFWDLIGNKQHSLGTNKPNLRSSKLGWLISGPMPTINNICQPNSAKPIICNFLLKQDNFCNTDLELSKFWTLESVPCSQAYSEEEKLCEKHYLANTTRDTDGRFCVGLPLKDNQDCLGQSYNAAKKRFFNLEGRFTKNPTLKEHYSNFIKEYADLGHLSESTESNPPGSYFLPHHPVLKDKSESTKLRVVFNASNPTSSGLSVNDLQMVGPTIQDTLFNILLRFRSYKYVLSGDIEKMYRQVLVRESDRNLQLILWRTNEYEPLRTLRLNTVTYGFASASFLTTRSIWQIGEESESTKIKTIIQGDFYCDDLLTGADTEDELRHIQQSVSKELSKGCFLLRKYRSNLPNLLLSHPINNDDSNLIISNATSTLGIGWTPTTDQIHFPLYYSAESQCTKRIILSTIFKIFDPLGLLSLCTIKAKILLQSLWCAKLDWDEPVPDHINVSWQSFYRQINTLSVLKIPRYVLTNESCHVELHCFCDASQKAYGSCIYIRSLHAKDRVQVNLLCSKARVAPLKACTIPRLELCGALLGAKLSHAVIAALRQSVVRQVFWTDSSVVLSWLKSPHKTKTFVANRIASICELTDPASWRHVPTAENPADLASRGVDPQEVVNSELWWHGPPFLKLPESNWPDLLSEKIDLPEMKAMPALIDKNLPADTNSIFKNFSKLSALQRIYAWVFRFLHNCKHPLSKVIGCLQMHELERSLTALTKLAQIESFPTEISSIQLKKPLKAKDPLCALNPFLDNQSILRVGGRIGTSVYSYTKKHPILLKANHDLTKLIFQREHLRLLHSGPQHLLASVRDRYWPLGGRKLARDIVKNCYVCQRFKGETMSNIMGNLPSDRVNPDFPFCTVGVDFAGPFLITDRKGRGCKITKAYLCIFVCFRYKCIHLELVSELSKDAFILTLKRFISRRGIPKTVYCDNGRNFVAAAKELGNFLNSNSNSICDFAANQGIDFRFSPVYAPHFNGLAEAGVKSAKFHLVRTLGQSHLTFEELTSIFAHIEAILNSRPLCPLSPSPNDFQPLTPAHFLIGRPLTALPDKMYVDVNTNRLNRYERLEQVKQHFWRRWSSEYVSELQQRTKWRERCRDLKLDDLVLIKEDNTPPLCWRLGRVCKLFPGGDGVPRVADIITARGVVRRAITKLCLLPNTDSA